MLNDFYLTIKEQFPTLTESEITLICKSIFLNVKETIKAGELETARVKYLGSFKVFPGKVRNLKTKYTSHYNRGLMGEKEYTRLMTMINKYELSRDSTESD